MTTRAARSFTQRTRQRIQAAKLVERLIQYIDGEVDMTRQQAYVALRLLNKVLPDLKAVAVDITDHSLRSVHEIPTAELYAIANQSDEEAVQQR